MLWIGVVGWQQVVVRMGNDKVVKLYPRNSSLPDMNSEAAVELWFTLHSCSTRSLWSIYTLI